MKSSGNSRVITALLCALAALAALSGTLPTRAQDARLAEYWAACRNGDVAKVREMLDAGMHVDTRFDAGMTPLAAAALRDQVEVAKLLVERGARLDLRDDSYQVTPLGYAIMFRQSKMVEFLLPRSTEDMDVALLYGVYRNQPVLVERALQSKPTPPELARAWQIAKNTKRDDIIAMLEKAGAQAPPVLKPEELARFAGMFEGSLQLELEIVVRDGKLIGSGGSGFDAFFEEELAPMSSDLLFRSGFPMVTFRFEGTRGKFERVTMARPGYAEKLTRKGEK